jgi:hypothetical protein
MADDERSPEIAEWLEVEPLDDAARRRLVSAALRETGDVDAPSARRPVPAPRSRTWRWIAAAAAVVIVAVVTLAVVTADGGNDEQQATRPPSTSLAPEALKDARDVGDFGNLDDPAHVAALRAALDQPSQGSAAPQAAAGAASGVSRSNAQTAPAGCMRGVIGTVVAQGSGTIGGHPVTVVLLEGAGGARSLDALFQDSCEIRHLGRG